MNSDMKLRYVIARTAKKTFVWAPQAGRIISTLKSHTDMAIDILKFTASDGSIVVKGTHGDLGVAAKGRKADKYH